MGQVFPWDAVHAGRVPKKTSFHRVARDMRETLFAESSIVSALLFGSVVRGDFNMRSDIDCVVIYKTEEQKSAMEVMHDIDRSASSLHVPINFTPCDTVLARTRFHLLGTAFMRHLQLSIAAGGLIKGDLAALLAPTVPVKQEIESYLSSKMYRLQESMAQMATLSEERMAVFLKKTLEAPMHVARKMLVYSGTLHGDSKEEVRERYCETMPRPLSDLFEDLVKADRLYSLDLALQVGGHPEQKLYEAVLGKVVEQVPKVLEFIRANLLCIDDVR